MPDNNGHSPFPPGSSVCSYLRDSGGERQELSVAQQRAVVESWCAGNGLTMARVFADAGRPGGTIAGREQLQEMMSYFLRGAPEAGIVFWDYSRWARSFDDGQYLLSSLRRKGYIVYSLEEKIPEGSIGKVIESLHLWSAEAYREQLSKNVRRGLAYVASVHHAYPRPHVPPGYRKVPAVIGLRRDGSPHAINRLEPDPLTAPLVQQAFTMRAGGATLGEIHDATHLHKFRASYQALLRNELYIGVFVFGGARIEDFCEPIVDIAAWDAVQALNRRWSDWRRDVDARISEQGAIHPRRARSEHLLSGLVRCGICGWTLNGQSTFWGERRYDYYRCAQDKNTVGARCGLPRIREDALDSLVLARVREFLQDDNVLQLIVDALRAEMDRPAPDATGQMRARLTGLEAAINRLLAAIEATGHSSAMLARLAELEQEQAALRAQLSQAEAEEQRRAERLAALTPEASTRAALEALAGVEAPDLRTRQLALRAVVLDVRVIKAGKEIGGVIRMRLPGTDVVREMAL